MSSETTPITAPRFAAALKDLSLASLHLKTLELRNSLAHLAYSNLQLRPFAEGTQATLDTANTNTSTSNTNNDDGFQPDPDCIEAIRENELVMDRMRERILLIKAEVEFRGVSWREFDDGAVEDADEENATAGGGQEQGREGGSAPSSLPLTNGVNGSADAPQDSSPTTTRTEAATATSNNGSSNTRNPWTDGTFQIGTIRNGQLYMDAVPEQSLSDTSSGTGAAAAAASAGSQQVQSQQQQAVTSSTGGAGGRLNDEELRRMLEDRLGGLGGDDNDEDDEGGLHL